MPQTGQAITLWHLVQEHEHELRMPRDGADLAITLLDPSDVGSAQDLYRSVGGRWGWTGRLVWTNEQWSDWMNRPGLEIWVAKDAAGVDLGYAELVARDDAAVEILCFGLLPGHCGSGLGGRLLSAVTRRSWDMATRWLHLPPTATVTVTTCSTDHEAALPNYLARGFRIRSTEEVSAE
ncbi:GNAT family N-acetyltransferase [Actinoplanes sp. NPDC020271]|uniref:GNAT family N-acetyltransferase n=1 Tax=Actinoplanes sp. NPDC020271 TaxID=3363896 RepID=UPI0037976A62